MISHAGSTPGLTRVRHGLVLASTLVLGLGIASSPQPALAGVSDAARADGVIVLAENDKNDKNDWNKNGNKNWHNNNNNNYNANKNVNKDWSKNNNNYNKNNGNWNKSGNKNWTNNNNNNYNKNWNKNGSQNWSHNNNYNKNWNKYGNKNWSYNYNNNWNKNWNNRAYVRNWYRRPYYGEFVGGIVLGSILAATGVGVVPYSPQPDVCWYWADPYMYQGYWDYCY